jgi:hypothetical protein
MVSNVRIPRRLIAAAALVLTACTSNGPDTLTSPPTSPPPTSSGPTGEHTAGGWRALATPHPGARVRVLTRLGDELLALGSIPGPAGRAPGAWVTRDLRTWTSVPLHPVTGYGKQAEFIRSGVYGGHISAFGQASGGAHGNPRPTMWTGNRNGLVEHVQSFTLFGGEDAISQNGETAGAGGSLIVGSWDGRSGYSAAVWTSPDGANWVRHQDTPGLASTAGEQTSARSATALDGRFLVVGDTQPGSGPTRALAWTSDDPRRWQRVPLPSPGADGATAARAACAPSSCVVIGARVSSAPRLLCWTLSAAGRRPQLGPLGPGGPLLEPDELLDAGRTLYAVIDTDASARLVAVDRDCSGWAPIALPTRAPDAAVGLLGTRMVLATTTAGASRLWTRPAP